MSIKSILCIFGGAESEHGAAEAALLLGKASAAHVRFLHVSPDPGAYAAMYGYGQAYACAALLEACEKENRERLKAAREYVTALAAKHHVPLDSADAPAHYAAAQFVHYMGSQDTPVTQEGRLSDLIVIGRGIADGDVLHHSAILAAIFTTGRPLLLLPQTPPAEYKTVALAWKGTLEAGRAMMNAMPFLEKAEKVYVLTAEGPGEHYDIDAEAAIIGYLRTHGIKAQCIIVAAGNRTPGEALLARAKELGADMLAMGAFGHTRLREMLLGGVTNHMLEMADIPLLLSH